MGKEHILNMTVYCVTCKKEGVYRDVADVEKMPFVYDGAVHKCKACEEQERLDGIKNTCPMCGHVRGEG